jgi:hypothetical protein
MSDPDDPLNQQHIPPSFVALYVPPGRIKPTISREALLERYGLCEDLAQMLTDTALSHRHAMGLSPADVLERVGRGLTGPDALTDAPESRWVLQRLAELLDWPAPA